MRGIIVQLGMRRDISLGQPGFPIQIQKLVLLYYRLILPFIIVSDKKPTEVQL